MVFDQRGCPKNLQNSNCQYALLKQTADGIEWQCVNLVEIEVCPPDGETEPVILTVLTVPSA
jgi:hypothetical protein